MRVTHHHHRVAQVIGAKTVVNPSVASGPLSASPGSNSTAARCVNPYPTEGGSVPIYSVAHGLVQKRFWIFRNAEWCDLCKEPVSQWVMHISRKDHALMDQHYTAMMEYPRRWNPETLLSSFAEDLHLDGGEALTAFHRIVAREDGGRRNDIYAMLQHLETAGMLHFGEARQTYLVRMQGGLRGLDHQGALVLHEFINKAFMRLYPDAHIQDYSNLVDFVTCSYNMETVYDLCGMYALDTVALRQQYKISSPAALGLGGVAASSAATSGFHSQQHQQNGDHTPTKQQAFLAAKVAKEQEHMEEEAFSRKAVFVRQVMGQLRWLLSPTQEHPDGFTFPPHMITLGELCLKYLVAEVVHARIVEYMTRVEPIWRNFGYERQKLDMKTILKNRHDVVPKRITTSYRKMSGSVDDLYCCESSKLDAVVRQKLVKKGLPIPAAFEPNDAPVL